MKQFVPTLCLLSFALITGCNASDQTPTSAPNVSAEAEVPGTPPPEATTTASGLAFQVLKQGMGEARPTLHDNVRVDYVGWSTKGPFDSKKKSGGTEVFAMNGVVAGWTEALLDMRVGERRRLWLPDKLAYPSLRANPTIWVFEVELLEILRGQPTVPARPDVVTQLPEPAHPAPVAAPPKDAQKTANGLAYRMEKTGDGGAKPTVDDRVVMTYTAWSADGKLLDSSQLRGKPSSFPLKGLIPGWAEGLQLMAKGDKATFWIPEALAYAGRPGSPPGMLVYEVELHDIRAR
jgi:FKBP-type peptidyl-prolyl cis-trans isomerase